MKRRIMLRLACGLMLAAALIGGLGVYLARRAEVLFPGVTGPAGRTLPVAAVPARWQQYDVPGGNSLAILLTDPDSAWLGLVQGLKSIGVPFRITTDVREALAHRVVLAYPTISGKVLDQESLKALAAFPREGGTLVGFDVAGGGLEPVFGFSHTVDHRSQTELSFSPGYPITKEFSHPRERTIPINSGNRTSDGMGVVSYAQARFQPLAVYGDGTAAMLYRPIGPGHAYAIGIDLGFFLLKGYNNRQQDIARSYANEFEPTLDVLLRLIRNIYRQGEPDAVTLGTVPQGRRLSVVMTYDIDYTESVGNALAYAEHQAQAGIGATYFVQTKYVRDWNDDAFFRPGLLGVLDQISGLGLELGSHSVSHSRVFSKFDLGSGDERYPGYRPFVHDATRTSGATVLGELRVSRFLIGRLTRAGDPVSFRPGHLQYPFSLPQAMEATGYRYSSSVTANTALTHLPFRLTHGRDTVAQSAIFEFPITIEDELDQRLGDRLPQALALAGHLERYGGLCVVLIHPNELGHKLEFQKRFVAALRDRAWFGSLRQFGDWWVARDGIIWRVRRDGTRRMLELQIPRPIEGIVLELPSHFRLTGSPPGALTATAEAGSSITLGKVSGNLVIEFETTSRP